MGRPSTLQCGVVLTVFAGFVATAELVWAKMLKDLGVPYFRLLGASALLSSFMFALCAKIAAVPVPPLSKAAWAVSRAVFGCLSLLTGIIALQVGAQAGDAAALMSINMVGAALMGHLFLMEKLQCVHIVALLLSVSGAIFISKPEVLFGVSESGAPSWVGNLLALVSGFLISGLFICARKSADVPKAYTCCCTAAVIALVAFVLPCTPLVEDGSLSVALASPWALLGLLAVTSVVTLLSIVTDTMGAIMCPAAVCATVRTASTMVCGYVAQTVLFRSAPDWLTVLGAVLMLVAVCMMAIFRVSQKQGPPDTEPKEAQVQQVVNEDSSVCSTDTSAESLASFVAAEYAEWEPHVTARLRRPAAHDKPVARTIGLGSTVAALAV